jgi:hypothetical protein
MARGGFQFGGSPACRAGQRGKSGGYAGDGPLPDGRHHGWVRVLGSGHPRLPRSLMGWNQGRTFQQAGDQPGFLLVADDVLGGFYAINGGALGPESPGDVYYFAPDTLRWESLERNYSNFLLFCLCGDLEKFYQPYRWPGWQHEIERLPGDRAISVWPFLFTAEGKDITRCSRRAVPIGELYGLYVEDLPRQLGS